jgi:hypothetical protein
VVGIETGAEFVVLVVGRAVVGQEVALVSGLQVESEGLRGTQKGCFLLRDIRSYYEDLYVDVDRRYNRGQLGAAGYSLSGIGF